MGLLQCITIFTSLQLGNNMVTHSADTLPPSPPNFQKDKKEKKAKASVLQHRIDTRRLTYALTVKSEDGEGSTCYYTSFTHL